MKMRNGSAVPGTRGEGARPETSGVVDEVGDDHINDLLGDPISRGRTCGRGLRGGTPKEQPLDSGQKSVPETFNNQFNH